MSSIKNSGLLPRIYRCTDDVSMVDYVDINYASLSLINLPTVTSTTTAGVNVFVSDITRTTARIHFSQQFIGKVHYTVIGFN